MPLRELRPDPVLDGGMNGGGGRAEGRGDGRAALLYADGAARGNPGPAALGVVLYDGDGRLLTEFGEYIGRATNNVAEYHALIRGLEAARAAGITVLHVFLDSELLVRQLNGQYRVKSPSLLPLHGQARALLAGFQSARVEHVGRGGNRRADLLANRALDQARAGGQDPAAGR